MRKPTIASAIAVLLVASACGSDQGVTPTTSVSPAAARSRRLPLH